LSIFVSSGALLIVFIVAALLGAFFAYKFVHRRAKSRFVALIASAFFAAIATGPLWWPYAFFPLPPDEELLSHLASHRADLEAVVARYRTFTPKPSEDPSVAWLRSDDTSQLLENAGVERVTDRLPFWLPNPYSMESGLRARELAVNAKDLSDGRRYGEIGLVLLPADRYRRKSHVAWRSHLEVLAAFS
jgi:hypothetical protein